MNKKLKNIAIFGGSFDPPHAAHVMAVSYAISCRRIDLVYVIPCYMHPFAKDISPFEHRFEMARLAFDIFSDHVIVSDIEKNFKGKSYTINTVRHLMKQHDNANFYVIAGSDIIKEKHEWKDFSELKKMVEFIFLHRSGHAAYGKTSPVRFPETSSTSIRRKIKKGLPVDDLVPAKVLKYIKQHGLYK
jgi:nicotinate-nucleotide adenylyltransferase